MIPSNIDFGTPAERARVCRNARTQLFRFLRRSWARALTKFLRQSAGVFSKSCRNRISSSNTYRNFTDSEARSRMARADSRISAAVLLGSRSRKAKRAMIFRWASKIAQVSSIWFRCLLDSYSPVTSGEWNEGRLYQSWRMPSPFKLGVPSEVSSSSSMVWVDVEVFVFTTPVFLVRNHAKSSNKYNTNSNKRVSAYIHRTQYVVGDRVHFLLSVMFAWLVSPMQKSEFLKKAPSEDLFDQMILCT